MSPGRHQPAIRLAAGGQRRTLQAQRPDAADEERWRMLWRDANRRRKKRSRERRLSPGSGTQAGLNRARRG